MENAGRYVLKSEGELAPLLQSAGPLLIVACNKCFQELAAPETAERDALLRLAGTLDRTVTGCVGTDFLCNSARARRSLGDALPSGTESVFVLACGLGVQTVAALTDVPVFAAADTLPERGGRGMALTDKRCAACAQCYLNLTGGICPVTDCAKGLLNGPCGGAKGGRCEADPNRDCAWERIFRRLAAQGRLEELRRGVLFRDYSRAGARFAGEYVRALRDRRQEGFPGGVHPVTGKACTADMPLRPFPPGETVVLPLSQHAGAPAEPVVKAGEYVKLGQLIGRGRGGVSCNVHASVSGVVLTVKERTHPILGPGVLSVVIRSDGRDTPHESLRPQGALEDLTPEEIVDIVRDKGVAGLGGAAFPTHVKLRPSRAVDTVLINGCECEPLLTADHRILLEYPEAVLFGLRAIRKAVGAERGILVIEDNKSDALPRLRELAAAWEGIEVMTVATKYPQGAEKLLIRRVLGRQVPPGGLPADAGVVVSNAGTAKAVSDAIQRGMPLIERSVTVAGEGIRRPGNFTVRLGTAVRSLLDACGGVERNVTVKMGGPMMGTTLTGLDVPIVKGSSGLVVLENVEMEARTCLRCGRCADVCPMELLPLRYPGYAEAGDVPALRSADVLDCIECGCCQYICPARIPLLRHIRAGKVMVKESRETC